MKTWQQLPNPPALCLESHGYLDHTATEPAASAGTPGPALQPHPGQQHQDQTAISWSPACRSVTLLECQSPSCPQCSTSAWSTRTSQETKQTNSRLNREVQWYLMVPDIFLTVVPTAPRTANVLTRTDACEYLWNSKNKGASSIRICLYMKNCVLYICMLCIYVCMLACTYWREYNLP